MKLLVYNFAQPGLACPEAGGVGVYLQMLVPALLERHVEVITLSSGKIYSPWSKTPFLAFGKRGRLKDAKIINSPVVAPSHENFFGIQSYLHDESLDDIPAMILQKYGYIDVFHFHNIEGLTLGFFWKLRRIFHSSKILLSAHNHSLVCPQVNLWKNDRENCTDFANGHACTFCVPYRDPEHIKSICAAGWFRSKAAYLPEPLLQRALRQLGLPVGDPNRRFSPVRMFEEPDRSQEYREYRARNVELANACFDAILAVSRRSKDILCRYGVEQGKLAISYIGSSFVADAKAIRVTRFQKPLSLVYLGYARRDKGFEFLLNAMETMPPDMTKDLRFSIVAKVYDERYVSRLRELRPRFAELRLLDGYSRANLRDILRQVHLGIVPPLWEDNLPQVAIELVACGIPILCSDLGGASELASNADFTFRAGSEESFVSKLAAIADGSVDLGSFWAREPRVFTTEAHIEDLLRLYRPTSGYSPALSVEASSTAESSSLVPE